ncbi:MAG: phosphopantetheine-binding protein [Gammaproteobacteria bacterium]
MSTEIPDDVRDAVHEILKSHAENDTSAMTAESTLEDIGVDSLAVIEIIYDVEEKFDITVPDISEIEGIEDQFKTVGDVVNAIGGLVVKARSESAAE